MTDKITLPMDVSKGLHFDFTIEGITEEQANKILDVIQEHVYSFGPVAVMAGGFFSVAHMEEMEQEFPNINNITDQMLLDFEDNDYDLLDMVDDDISLDDLEDEEEEDYLKDIRNNFWGPDDLSDYE